MNHPGACETMGLMDPENPPVRRRYRDLRYVPINTLFVTAMATETSSCQDVPRRRREVSGAKSGDRAVVGQSAQDG